MHLATFVLSTGRCGTQWLAQALAEAGGDRLRVEHEPLHDGYAPRRMLGAGDPGALDERTARRVTRHLAEIERTLESRDYFEAGHPCWSSVPWLAQRLAGRVRVVHLVRHPVPTACSWVSHGAFVPPLLPHLPAKEFISPSDGGVSFPEYGAAWPALTPFEKCLVYWAEVNAFGLRLEREAGIPWLRLRYEELFDPAGDALARLGAFVGVSPERWTRIDRSRIVDRHRFALADWPEPGRIARHPQVMAVAAALGYRAEAFATERFAARFFPRPGNEGATGPDEHGATSGEQVVGSRSSFL